METIGPSADVKFSSENRCLIYSAMKNSDGDSLMLWEFISCVQMSPKASLTMFPNFSAARLCPAN